MKLDEFKKKLLDKKDKLIITIEDKISKNKINFSISNEKTLWRAQTLLTKEPITIEWIRSFKKNSVFYDVGANVGIYTMFAASVSEARVFSFEPEANNFQALMENIVVNNLTNKINSYPIGISDKTALTNLFLSKFERGSSHHMVGQTLDHNLQEKKFNLKQGIFSTSLDEILYKWNLPAPDYLKIDVDGIESKIIQGAKKTLKNKNLKSILIEININRDEDMAIIDTLKKNNFDYDPGQVDQAERKKGPHKGYAEFLFLRK